MSTFTTTLSLILAFSATAQAANWDLNDVSILLPLPSALHAETSLAPGTLGDGGSLIPSDLLVLLPALLPAPNDPKMVLAALTAVGMRIDPCFIFDPSAPLCQAQLRIVWQPLVEVGGAVSAGDAAVHSFYNLTADEFRTLTARLAALGEVPAEPLGVHPTLAAQGFDGPYWSALRALVLAYAGPARLARVTFMTTDVPDKMWDFGGFDVAQAKVTTLVISRINSRHQSFINSNAGETSFAGGNRPAPPIDASNDGALDRLLENSSALGTGDAPVLRSAVDAAFRIENPKLNSPATVDCATCHAAQPARLWAAATFPTLGLDHGTDEYLAAAFNLANRTAPGPATHVLRQFGYFGTTPAISQRVINESAAIAAALNARP